MIRGRFVAGAVAALVLAAACGSSDTHYVSNGEGGLFLKLPDTWTVFQVTNGKVDPDLRVERPGRWRVVIDRADEPSRAHLEQPAPEAPVGVVEIVPTVLLEDPGAFTSFSALRSLLLNGEQDPLEAPEEEGLQVDKYVEYQQPNGYWGTRITATLETEDEGEVTITQLAFLDGGAERIYALRLFCSAACWDDHEDELEEILESWTLEAR